jgi:phosphocarrier protein
LSEEYPPKTAKNKNRIFSLKIIKKLNFGNVLLCVEENGNSWVEVAFSIQLQQKFCVKNRLGLHATPAAMIVKILNKYPGIDVWVRNAEEQVNGKSIMGLMVLEARRNAELLFIIDSGTMEEQQTLVAELKCLFENKFFED